MSDAKSNSDDVLMCRLAEGDETALDELFSRHKEHVFSLAYRHLGDRTEAEDVTQDAFLRVLLAAPRYRGEGTFRTWLLTITSRLCLKRRARHFRWRERLVGLLHPAMETVDSRACDPAERLVEDDLARRVRLAVESLPADQRMAVILARFEDLSYEEIAMVMGKSIQSVTSLLWRGRAKLRGELADLAVEIQGPTTLSSTESASFRRAGGSR